jgi:tRNA threonylcarbamoyladenosine biosynthesis protein TsaE
VTEAAEPAPVAGAVGRAPSANARVLGLTTGSADQTRALAAALADLCRAGDVVLLVGDLGAGKTVFAQGFGAGLGITGPITSPTFTLVRQYPVADRSGLRSFVHADVYRLDRLHEVVDLDLGELVEEGGVALVEWGEAARPLFGQGALTVQLETGPVDTARVVTVWSTGDAWADRWPHLVRALAPWEAGE